MKTKLKFCYLHKILDFVSIIIILFFDIKGLQCMINEHLMTFQLIFK